MNLNRWPTCLCSGREGLLEQVNPTILDANSRYGGPSEDCHQRAKVSSQQGEQIVKYPC